jgi:N6-L-threonylcarbamoyladenine synthase
LKISWILDILFSIFITQSGNFLSIRDSKQGILSNIVISQTQDHFLYKGVVPEIAARSHLENIETAINRSLSEASLELKEIDAIAATSGPGLIGGVIVGSMYGKAIASAMGKPFKRSKSALQLRFCAS